VTLLLVSRRSCLRQGRRFVKRGIDAEGNVANMVETEQAVILPDGHLTSLVQIRGSIPLFWSSPANLQYTPPVTIERTLLENSVALARHARELVAVYGQGPIACVNLIDMKGDQGRLGRALELVLGAVAPSLRGLAPLRHVWFDFHHECRKMRWENLGKLLATVEGEARAQGYFERDARGQVVRLQSGVLRTNCMDCLDRTNVVQSIFARWSLREQLEALAGRALDRGGTVLQLPFEELERSFRQLWSSNADAISLLYAGTPALKGDFTRTGKRTKRGVLTDGINSAKRYFINNLVDDINQVSARGRAGLFL
jgi:phosphatidylinositol 4-phosphatase